MSVFKVGAWLLEFWWVVVIVLVVVLVGSLLAFGGRVFTAIAAFFRFLQSPAGMIAMLLVAGYFCISFGVKMAEAECDSEQLRADIRRKDDIIAGHEKLAAEREGAIRALNSIVGRDLLRAVTAEQHRDSLQSKIDDTPTNSSPCLDVDARRRVYGIKPRKQDPAAAGTVAPARGSPR
jgi:hypothetical protein